MTQSALKPSTQITWDDYQGWDDGERWEIIDGEAFAMSPSPQSRHQRIAMDLGWKMRSYFNKKPCQIFGAPMDVKLSESDIVQPDILVVCDTQQIKRTHIEGAPTLVVEILSPSSIHHDRLRKLYLYARFGIKEYWIVTPYPSLVEVFSLSAETYTIAGVYAKNDSLRSPSFPEMSFPLADVFDFPIDPDEVIDEIRESTPPYSASKKS